jgi:gas vesicle protein
MKGNIVVGMLAGTMVGAVAAMIAMPYISPQINKLMSQGKKMISQKLNQMDTEINSHS